MGVRDVGVSSAHSWPVAGNCWLRTQHPHLTGILGWTPRNGLDFWARTVIDRKARQALKVGITVYKVHPCVSSI